VSINNPTVLNNNEERGKMDLKKGKSSNIKGTKASSNKIDIVRLFAYNFNSPIAIGRMGIH
jgi:hypothetical protein